MSNKEAGESPYAATLDLGPGIETLVDRQIRLALKEVFDADKVRAMVDDRLREKVRSVVDEEVQRARSGWMSQELRADLNARILDRILGGNIPEKLDELIAAAWKKNYGEDARMKKEVTAQVDSQIREQVWQLHRDGSGLAMIKAEIENLVKSRMAEAANTYAGRTVLRFLKESSGG